MKFAYTRPDGGVSIVIAAPKADIEKIKGTMTDAEYRDHVVGRSIPHDATDVVELPENWGIPDTDRTFRDAWRHQAGKFTVDMISARALWRDKMRKSRAVEMEKLDVAYMRADEKGDTVTKNKITQDKQALRDVTADPAIEAAQTPDELRAVWPTILGART